MNRKERLLRYWLIFYLWMIFIFIGSSIPTVALPAFRWNIVDLTAHFIEYLILGFLCVRAIKVSFSQFNSRTLFAFAFLFSLLYAITDEIHQYFVPGRLWEVRDLISDGLGVTLGILLYKKIGENSWLK